MTKGTENEIYEFPKSLWRTEMKTGWTKIMDKETKSQEGSTEIRKLQETSHLLTTLIQKLQIKVPEDPKIIHCMPYFRDFLYITINKCFTGILPTWTQFIGVRLSLNIGSLYIVSLSGDVQTIVLTPKVCSNLENTEGGEAWPALLCLLCIELVSKDNSCYLQGLSLFPVMIRRHLKNLIEFFFSLKQMHGPFEALMNIGPSFLTYESDSAILQYLAEIFFLPCRLISLIGPGEGIFAEVLLGTALSVSYVLFLIFIVALWGSFLSISILGYFEKQNSNVGQLNPCLDAGNTGIWKADQRNCLWIFFLGQEVCHAGTRQSDIKSV